MRVLSLFDGISCGKVALERAGISITKYVSSEIDSHAIAVSKHNHSNIEYVGDVKNLEYPEGSFDLILAGSPCQGFSKSGLGLNFQDERSKLYFEFLRLIKEIKPKYFLLENVRMKQEFVNQINSDLQCESVLINSSLVSAQNRERLYWSNINFKKPDDKNIHLQDLIGKYKGIYVVPRGTNPGGLQSYKGKSPCITSSCWEYNFKIVREDDSIELFTSEEMEQLQTLPIGYTSCLPKSRRSKVLGNCWTVDVVSHILSSTS